MALEKDSQFEDSSLAQNKLDDAKDPQDLKEPLDSDKNADIEGARNAPYGTSNGSVGGRIAPVLPHLAGYDFGSDDTGSDILGKQIELEAGNAIQYRTCSWPKASRLLPLCCRAGFGREALIPGRNTTIPPESEEPAPLFVE